MNSIEIGNAIDKLNYVIHLCMVENKEIPRDLTLRHNKLLNDYNEAWKKENTKPSKS